MASAQGNMYIVEELASFALDDLLALHEVEIDWKNRLRIAKGIAKGILHLHSQSPKILHRDLKSGNVLVRGSGSQTLVLMLLWLGVLR
jgi:serine/threonine protein kinase